MYSSSRIRLTVWINKISHKRNKNAYFDLHKVTLIIFIFVYSVFTFSRVILFDNFKRTAMCAYVFVPYFWFGESIKNVLQATEKSSSTFETFSSSVRLHISFDGSVIIVENVFGTLFSSATDLNRVTFFAHISTPFTYPSGHRFDGNFRLRNNRASHHGKQPCMTTERSVYSKKSCEQQAAAE